MVMTTENLGKVLTLIQVSGESGVLTFVPTVPPEKAAWLATCALREGKLLRCQVTRRVDGEQLTDSQALAWLQQQPHAFWYLQPCALADPSVPTNIQKSEARTVLPSPPGDGHVVPRRTALGESISVQMIVREERAVFVLLDGRRSKDDILRLLPACHDLDHILEHLAQCGFITF